MDDDDDWEELDETAMDECMVLATQLCSKLPTHPTAAAAAAAQTNQHLKTQHGKSFSEVDSGRQSDCTNNGRSSSVNDSGVWSHRSSNWQSSVSNSSRSSRPPPITTRNSLKQLGSASSSAVEKEDSSQTDYRSRFSDFSSTTNSAGLSRSSLSRKSSSSGRGQVPAVTSIKSSPSKIRNPCESMTKSDGNEGNAHLLHKAQEEKKELAARIVTMQGEISLLRSEMKRKESALEAERIERCAAVEAAEKTGREKAARQVAEANTKLKEKGALLDKLQGELHFKKREVEELLIRCHQLEQLPDLSQTPGPAKKRPRIEKASTNLDILSRFDFGVQGAAKLCSVAVQTESLNLPKLQRHRLAVAMPKGRVHQTRSIATLLSACGLASTSASSTQQASGCGSSDRWSLPSEWLTYISQALRENDSNIENNLVSLAVEQLVRVHEAITGDSADQSSVGHACEDPVKWYESQVGPPIQVFSHFKISSELSVLKAITTHLLPLNYKDVVVNRRTHVKLLEAAEMVIKNLKCHTERTNLEASSLLKECCGSIESDKEARILLRITAALVPHSQLCTAAGACPIGQLCKKVKKLCVADLGMLRVLLDLTWGVVKVAPPSACLSQPCHCSSQLLGTFLWHLYQVLESSHLSANKKKLFQAVISCIHVLHHWSVIDPDWWDKVSHFSQYPVLMVTIAAKAKDLNLKRDTVDLLCDLYEFDEGTFER